MGQVISNVYSFPSYSSLPCGTRVANLILLSAPLMQRELVDRGGRNLGTLLQLNLEGDLSCWRKREKFTIRESSLPIPRIVVTLSLADWHMLQLCNCLSHQQGHRRVGLQASGGKHGHNAHERRKGREAQQRLSKGVEEDRGRRL